MVEDIPVAGTPLDPGLFSGKRRSPRRRRTLSVDVSEPGGTVYEARTVDVSRGGMLLEFVDEKLKAPSDPAMLVGFASRLMTMFPTGMQTVFGSGAVRTHAAVVRLVSSGSTASPILLGCRFDEPLNDVDCKLLGIEADGDETSKPPPAEDATAVARTEPGFDALLSFLHDASRSWDLAAAVGTAAPDGGPAPMQVTEDDLALVNRAAGRAGPVLGSPMAPPWAEPGEAVLHLFPLGAAIFGPRFRGRLADADGTALAVDLPVPTDDEDPFAWAAGLGARARLVALLDGRVLWETVAEVLRLDVGPDESVRATLRAAEPAPAALVATLGAAATA